MARHKFKIGQRVNLLSKSIGESYKTSEICRYYEQGIPVFVKQIRSDGILRVSREGMMLGGYFKPRDLAPWNSLEESEEL